MEFRAAILLTWYLRRSRTLSNLKSSRKRFGRNKKHKRSSYDVPSNRNHHLLHPVEKRIEAIFIGVSSDLKRKGSRQEGIADDECP